jgi:hypothetical protein
MATSRIWFTAAQRWKNQATLFRLEIPSSRRPNNQEIT